MAMPQHRTVIAAFLLLFLSLLTTSTADAKVTVPSTRKRYQSRTASFGFQFERGLQYEALLQVVEDDLNLCAGSAGRLSLDDEDSEGQVREIEGDDALWNKKGWSERREVDAGSGRNNNSNLTDGKEWEQRMIHIVPSREMPVAILGRRGEVRQLQTDLFSIFLLNSFILVQITAVLLQDQGNSRAVTDLAPWHCEVPHSVRRRRQRGSASDLNAIQDACKQLGQSRVGVRQLREWRGSTRVRHHPVTVRDEQGRATHLDY